MKKTVTPLVCTLKNIYIEQELSENSTTELFSVVQKEEHRRNVGRTIKFFNLDAIISVGYRVNSKRGTLFRLIVGLPNG
ncbi:MAG: virulence RhuM family protein [Ignavibacteriales bacterium]|nr:virulence RhuM family protein [Ignavibacteriales bacterium]